MNRWRERVNSGEIRQTEDTIHVGDANAYFDRLVEQHLQSRTDGQIVRQPNPYEYDEQEHLRQWAQTVSDHSFNGDVTHDIDVMIRHITGCLQRGQYDRQMIRNWIYGLDLILKASLSTSPTTSEELLHGTQCDSYSPEIGWDRDDQLWVACRHCDDVWYPKDRTWKSVRKAVKAFRRFHDGQ